MEDHATPMQTTPSPIATSTAHPPASRARRAARLLVGAILILLIGAAGWYFSGPKVWTDGDTVRLPDAPHAVREIAWTAPKPLTELNAAEQQYEPSVSPDGLELYFVRNKPGRNADIFVSRRTGERWSEPVPLDGVNSDADDLGPRVSPDNRYLLFYSNRTGGVGGYDLWAARRSASPGGWGAPFNLGAGVNSEFDEYNPAPTPDGKRLFFATNRTAAAAAQKDAWRATIRAANTGDFDLWMADLDEIAIATPTTAPTPASQPTAIVSLPSTNPDAGRRLTCRSAREVPGVNTPFTEGASCMSPAGDFLYFASNRPGGFGKFDLYRSRVTGDTFSPPENLGSSVNTSDNEADPQLALGGFRIYFSSDRSAGAAPLAPAPTTAPSSTQPALAHVAPAARGYGLFQSDSREVYASRPVRPLPAISAVGWSWWVLLASALLLVPLVMFMRNWDDRHLSILQKCLLVSVLLHVLLTFSFSLVKVAEQLPSTGGGGAVRRLMSVVIHLNPSTEMREAEVASAIRQQSNSDLPAPQAAPGELSRQQPGAEAIAPPASVQVHVPQAGRVVNPLAMTPPPGPKLDAPRIAPQPPPVAVQAVPPPMAPRIEDIGSMPPAAPRVHQAEAVAQPQPQDVAVAKAEAPGSSPIAPAPVTISAGPVAVVDAKSMASAAAAMRSSRAPIDAPMIKPTVTEPAPASTEVAVTLPPAAQRLSDAAAPSPTPGEAAAPVVRQAMNPADNVAAAPLPAGVAPKIEAVASNAAGPSLANAPGAGIRIAPGAIASAAPTGAPDATAASDLIAAPTVAGPRSQPKPIAGGDPAAPAPTEAVGGSGRQGNAEVATGPAVKLDGNVPSAGAPATGSFAAMPTTRPIAPAAVALAGAGSASAVSAATLGGADIGAAPAIDGPHIAVHPIAPATGGNVSSIAPRGAGDAIAATGKVDTAAASVAGAPSGAANVMMDLPGSAGAVAAGAGDASLVTPASVGARHVELASTSAPVVAPLISPAGGGAGAGTGVPGIEGPQINVAKIAQAPMRGTAGGAPAGTGDGPGGGPDGGPLLSQRTTPPGAGIGGDARGELASLTTPVGNGVPNGLSGPGDGAGTSTIVNVTRTHPRPIETPIEPAIVPQVAIALPRISAPDSLFQRSAQQRKPLVEKMGGNQQSENAVARGLAYLARQQEPDGRWTLIAGDRKAGGAGKRARNASAHDMADTGLAVLAFLAADHSPAREGPYRDTVAKGVQFLVDHQEASGDLRGVPNRRGAGSAGANMYDHAIATMAIAEAALMTGDRELAGAASKAADFIVAAQNPQTGGWRYVPGDPGDTSVLGWQLLALHDCEQLGYKVPPATKTGAASYLRSVSRGHGGLACYQPSRREDPVMTAEALFCRMLLDQPISDELAAEASEFVTVMLPQTNAPNLYYWYYASLSLSQVQNGAWKRWNERTRDALVAMQKQGGGDADGSWDSNGHYDGAAGRVYCTALATLTLEVYYRYLPLHPENTGKGDRVRAPAPAAAPVRPRPAFRPLLEPN